MCNVVKYHANKLKIRKIYMKNLLFAIVIPKRHVFGFSGFSGWESWEVFFCSQNFAGIVLIKLVKLSFMFMAKQGLNATKAKKS